MSKKEDNQRTIVQVGLGTGGSEIVNRYGNAAAEYIRGYTGETGLDGRPVKGLKDISRQKTDPSNPQTSIKQQSGFAAEIHYENKTNAENIIQGKSQRIRRSDAIGERNHPTSDHVAVDQKGKPILKDGSYTGTSQMKMRSKSGQENVQKLVNSKEFEKYKDNNFLDIPSGQFDEAKRHISEQKKLIKQQIQELNKKGDTKALQSKKAELSRYESVEGRLRNSGISEDKAVSLRLRPMKETVEAVHNVSKRAAETHAKNALVISGAISMSQNIAAYARGDKELGDAAFDVVKDTTIATAGTYTVTYVGTSLQAVMSRSTNNMISSLSRSNVPSMLVTTTLEVGKSLKRYAEGELTELELVEELGEKGTGIMAASMAGAVGTTVGAVIGTTILPFIGTNVGAMVGGVIGGMVGYMTSSTIYRSALGLLHEERLSDEKRERIRWLAEEALIAMDQQQKDLELLIKTFYRERLDIFIDCFEKMNQALVDNDVNAISDSLNQIALAFGKTLQFKNFAEFDEFMNDKHTVLDF